MIVIVASRHDDAAREIVARWEGQDAALLTCEDLSTAGWQHRLFDQSASQIVVSGRVVPESEIYGVLVRRPWVFEKELTHIASSDREYVAAEMNAFLFSWLSHLSCRVLNRPGGTCLCGPSWRPQQWAQAASRAGMQVEAMHWGAPPTHEQDPRVSASRAEPSLEVIVVGERCLGAQDDACVMGARRLALLAGTGLLAIRLSKGEGGPRFLSANPMPSLKDPGLANVVCDYLMSN